MIKNFDLTGWTCFSERRNSTSYYSPDKKWMVKFSTELAARTVEDFRKEQIITQKAREIGVKTPDVGDIVETYDGKIGLIYEYIETKKSIARAVSKDLEHIDDYMRRFANISKDVHSKICSKEKFDNWEDRIKHNIEKYDIMTPENKKKCYELMDKVEKKYNCLHGDFQTGNFIITDTEEYAIDLGGIAYGNPVYDVAVFYNFLFVMPTYVSEHIFHCEHKYNTTMWESFVKYYFGTTDKKEIEDITNAIKKYSILAFFGMFELADPTEDIPVFKKVYNEVFEEGMKYDRLISL